jgi:hypothetical protein
MPMGRPQGTLTLAPSPLLEAEAGSKRLHCRYAPGSHLSPRAKLYMRIAIVAARFHVVLCLLLPASLRIALAFVFAVMVVVPCSAQIARSGDYRLRVTAVPPQVPADGKSEVRLRVEVRAQSGELAAEQVQVIVTTSLGLLSGDQASRQQTVYATAIGGVASVVATSDTPGLCTVTARVREARNSINIRFLAEGEASRPVSNVLHMGGEWVGYSVDQRVIQARDEASVQLGHLNIRASDTIDVDLNSLTLRAFALEEDGVVVADGESELSGQQLYFDISERRGVICGMYDGEYRRLFFDGYDLQLLTDEWEIPADAFAQDMRETYTWMIADSISFFIGEKLVLRHGSAWAGEQRVLRFPSYWIIGLPGYAGSSNTDMLSVDSGGGVALDVPFFYSVTSTSTAAVKVQHGTHLGSAATRRGWALGWQSEYRALDDSYQGSVELGGLPRSNWGLQWQDQRSLGHDVNAYFNISSPDHRSLFSDANFLRYGDHGRYNLRSYVEAARDYDTNYGVVADWLSNPQRFASRNWYRLGITASAQRDRATGRIEFGNMLLADLDLGSHALGSRTAVRPQLRNQFSWDTSGYRANGLRGGLDLAHRLGQSSSLALGYSAEYFSGDSTVQGLEQILTLDLNASRGKFYLFASGNRNLTFDDSFAFLDLSFWPNDQWRWQLSGTFYDFDVSSYSEWEISVARMFGQQEIGLTYSAETNRLSLLLGGLVAF